MPQRTRALHGPFHPCGFSPPALQCPTTTIAKSTCTLCGHTKLSRPLLKPDIETMAFTSLREKVAALGDIVVHEIGGTENHVHLVVSVEPTVLIADMIGAIKGYSAHEVNRRCG